MVRACRRDQLSGYARGEQNGVALHHATYRPLKDDYPALVRDHHIQARVKATEAIKSALTLAKQGRKVSAPRSRSCPPRYNVHTFKADWVAGSVRLSTTGGRITVPFVVPAYAAPYVGAKTCTAELMHRDGTWFLHIVVDFPAPAVAHADDVIGVDLGVAQPAVTSDNRFLGKRAWRNTENRYFKQRRALQARGSKSARRHLRKVRGKHARFRRDCDHGLSTRVVRGTVPGATIVVEHPTGIRARVRSRRGKHARRVHGWSFAQLRSSSSTKPRLAVARWSVSSRDTRATPARAVVTRRATTGGPVPCSSVVRVTTRCIATSSGPGTSRPSTVTPSVYLSASGGRSTRLPSRMPAPCRKRQGQAPAFRRG